MKNRINEKECFFCDKPSSFRMTLDPGTKELKQVYYAFGYKGKTYFCCDACGAFWNVGFDKIQSEHRKAIDILFETLVLKKGVFDENKPA